jgi:hypothetical protein
MTKLKKIKMEKMSILRRKKFCRIAQKSMDKLSYAICQLNNYHLCQNVIFHSVFSIQISFTFYWNKALIFFSPVDRFDLKLIMQNSEMFLFFI